VGEGGSFLFERSPPGNEGDWVKPKIMGPSCFTTAKGGGGGRRFKKQWRWGRA